MKYLELATQIARANSSAKSFLFGIVAEKSDRSIVISTNLRTKEPCHSAHAEHRVLRKCGWGATLWIARVDRNNNWALAKPCVKCQALIKNKGVVKVIYTISPGEYGVWKI